MEIVEMKPERTIRQTIIVFHLNIDLNRTKDEVEREQLIIDIFFNIYLVRN